MSLVVGTRGSDDLSSLPLLVGVGLGRKISEISGAACRLKWPNDLVVSRRKIGGILIECVSRGTTGTGAVIGVGVNYGVSPALSEVGGIAIDEIDREPLDLAYVISELLVSVEDELTHIGDMAYAATHYRELSAHSQGDTLQFRTKEGIRRGSFSGLDDRGHLVLQSDRGEIRLSAGETIEEWTGESHDS